MQNPLLDTQDRDLQERLALISQIYGTFPIATVNGAREAEQKEAVAEVQKLLGLPPTGIVDQATREGIIRLSDEIRDYCKKGRTLCVYPGNRVFVVGDEHEIISLVKHMLHSLAERYSNFSKELICDGKMDQETANALCALQKCCSMEESGALNKETWNQLAALYEQHMERLEQ